MSAAVRYERPDSLDEALACLQQNAFQIIAGGTDFYPSLGVGLPQSPVLDITLIDELRGITFDENGLTIGALCSWSEIISADLPPAFRALQLAAIEVGSVQIQSRATVAGNLCNASPAADGVPPLLVVDASVNIASASGTRSLPVTDFIQGNRKTQKQADEIVTSVFIPTAAIQGASDFIKLGARKYLVISIAMVASRVVLAQGNIKSCAISVGSCSETAVRLPEIENELVGKPATEETVLGCLKGEITQLKPLDDIRSSAMYRHQAVATLIKRSLLRSMAACDGGVVQV